MRRDEILQRLFRAAAVTEAPPEMPFGFDTRVLALARASLPNGTIALLARRIAMIALAVIVLAGAGAYRASMADGDLPSEYVMTDTAIRNNLGE